MKEEKRHCYIIRFRDGYLRAETGTIEEVKKKAEQYKKEHGPIEAIA